MLSRPSARLAKIEQALKPEARLFTFHHFDGDEPGLDERLAAFKVEHGVTPQDQLVVIHVTFDG
jgi:hypothetical protein